ncbi:hypothetical protein Q3G72_028120 [Acer saccharum]|nr:hypothetical protein Q3G72_028120 [Acer saccharum]
MGSQASQLHFIMLPFLAQGHLIPMVDIAKLLAQQGAIVTIFTTPVNAARFKNILMRAISSGLQIRVNELEFPTQKAGLPDGCENFDLIPSMDLIINFFNALNMLQLPAEKKWEQITPPPSCIISDMCFPWTTETATAEQISYGVIINTFEELEAGYVKEFKKVKSGKVWCVGPVSLCNKDTIDKVERGNKASIDESECLKWLDSWQPSSIGVRIGVESPLTHGEEEKIGVLVKKEDVEKAVHELMDDGEERDERRRRARELGVIANRAIEKGGSSYNNIGLLIQDIMQQAHRGGDQLNKCD